MCIMNHSNFNHSAATELIAGLLMVLGREDMFHFCDLSCLACMNCCYIYILCKTKFVVLV